MQERVIDRTDWESGPWDRESDRHQFKTATGLPGLIVRNPMGALCGYVGVEHTHSLYGVDYNNVDVEVHGGLTYSDKCQEDGPICHVPDPGESDDVWWFGFDCGHFNDVLPGMEARERKMGWEPLLTERKSYKSFSYVRIEVEELARQLVQRA